MSKQTAVEWLFDKMKGHFEHDRDLFETACMTCAHALEMEQNQIMLAYQEGRDDEDTAHKDDTFERTYEDYYRETYGGDE